MLKSWGWNPHKRGSKESPTPLDPGKIQPEVSDPEGVLLWPCRHPNLRCPASRPWEINLCCLHATHSALFCYNSPNGVRQCNLKCLHLHRYGLYLSSWQVCEDNFQSHPALPSTSLPTSSNHRARKIWMKPCAETPGTLSYPDVWRHIGKPLGCLLDP